MLQKIISILSIHQRILTNKTYQGSHKNMKHW